MHAPTFPPCQKIKKFRTDRQAAEMEYEAISVIFFYLIEGHYF